MFLAPTGAQMLYYVTDNRKTNIVKEFWKCKQHVNSSSNSKINPVLNVSTDDFKKM